jgi:O-methyltransferase involved in polyketide biosynthesis
MTHVQIAEDDVLSLAGRAVARTRFPDIGLSDPCAEELLRALDVDVSRFDEPRLRVAAVRTAVLDGVVRDFFARHPDGLAVAVFPGLCTRFSRVDNGQLRWVDLDPPPLARFKSQNHLYPEGGRHVLAACCSLACTGWMTRLRDAVDVPVLLVASGIMSRHPAAAIDAFFTDAAKNLPAGTEILFDYDVCRPVRAASLRDRACLEIATDAGQIARYPRLRVVSVEEYPACLARDVIGLNGVSRFLGGRGVPYVPSVAHLRLV